MVGPVSLAWNIVVFYPTHGWKKIVRVEEFQDPEEGGCEYCVQRLGALLQLLRNTASASVYLQESVGRMRQLGCGIEQSSYRRWRVQCESRCAGRGEGEPEGKRASGDWSMQWRWSLVGHAGREKSIGN